MQEDNEPGWAQKLCAECPRGHEIDNPLLFRLIDMIWLQEAGCPIERHELTMEEWKALGHIKSEQRKIDIKELQKNRSAEG